jgi:hypothetical protein
MYCVQCGKQISREATFCGYCSWKQISSLEPEYPDIAIANPPNSGGWQQAGALNNMSVLNHAVSEIASAYRRIATKGAYALPEEVSVLLLHTWIADTRGESFEVGQTQQELGQGLLSFGIWYKEAVESAAREGHVELVESDDHVGNIAAVLYRERHLTHREAFERCCQQLRRGSHLASSDEIKPAYGWLRREVQAWLTRNNIK